MQKGKDGKRGPGVEKGIQDEITALPRQNLKIFAVAIDEYEHANYWPKLEYPVTDCERLLVVLKDRYGAECVVELYDKDATFEKVKRDILELTTGGAKELGPEDDLIILFSGHSYRSDHGVGGFVMHDSGDADKPQERDKMINPTWLFNQFKQMSAWRILLIVDTCYGLQFSKVQVDSLPDSGKLTLKKEFRPGRWTLSSSRDGEAPDYSRFMRGIAGLLDRNEEEQLLLKKLDGELSTDLQNFKQDLPMSKDLVTDDKLTGDFVFSRKMPEPYPKKSHLEFLEALREGSSKYLEKLSQERFCYARIEELLPGTDSGKLMSTEVEVAKKRMLLTTAVREKRKDTGKPHVLLLGDGGMGKTTSLLHLWESMLTCQEDPIPVFIALNEYNHARKGEQKNYLTWYIARHYLGVKDPDPYLVEDQLWKLLQVNPTGEQPEIILLLDGFNEVSSDQTELLEELSWASKAKNVQIVLTSRYVETQRFIWVQHMEEVRLLPLEEDLIRQYLATIHLDYPEDRRLKSVLTNPMMLASYAKTEHLAKIYGGEHSPYFFYEAKTEAEILWNFNEALLAKAMDNAGDADDQNENEKNSLKKYIVRKLFPYLAWRMEKEGLFFISLESNIDKELSFDSVVKDAFGELPDMELAVAKNRGKDITAKEKRKATEHILNFLKEQLHLLIQEGKELRFLHQNFRDFYAACHLLNCIKVSIAEERRPEEWKERALPIYLRKMIGQLQGEHEFNANAGQSDSFLKSSSPNKGKLRALLESCRGKSMGLDNTVWNLVTLIYEQKRNLVDMDFSKLDLFGLNFNNIQFSQKISSNYRKTNFHHAKVSGKQFVFMGHSDKVSCISYSSDGKKILSSSYDMTIKEWLIDTKQCIKTYRGHHDRVNSAKYNSDNRKIISASDDGTIREWEVNSDSVVILVKSKFKKFKNAKFNLSGSLILIEAEESENTYKLDREEKKRLGDNPSNVQIKEKLITRFGAFTQKSNNYYLEPDFKEKERKYKLNEEENKPKRESKINSKINNLVSVYSNIEKLLLFDFEEVNKLSGANNVIFNHDETAILSVNTSQEIEIRSVTNFALLFKKKLEKVSIDKILSYDNNKITLVVNGNSIIEWSIKKNKIVNRYSTGKYKIVSSDISKTAIITYSSDKVIREWKRGETTCKNKIKILGNEVKSIQFAAFGRNLLLTNSLGSVTILDLDKGYSDLIFDIYNRSCSDSLYNRESNLVISPIWNNNIVNVWSAKNGKCVDIIKLKNENIELDLASEKIIKLWAIEASNTFLPLRVNPFNSSDERFIEADNKGTLTEYSAFFHRKTISFDYDPGLYVQGLDLRNLHPDSVFTEEEKERMRKYGAIFNDQDKADWEAAVKDAYGNREE
ncbi:NACHT domain-containing protein [Algoriphagus aestuariicola]|uniref:NACHT domain-containing protein n=1 Tax=Algoriphagus aestuariicola TaxID=1852016 RepID=A0ABS3BPE2_9BACT|nr:NACHT domain-containing protein [Algoriphagus aestuariicola]MBN7801177.1 NACHT domain-containing protein [Algoriphagus aestuariicola]